MKIHEVIKELNQLSPPSYALSWDNVGLSLGDSNKEVKKILVTLDVTNKVVEYAISNQVDFIISHHPLIFSPMKQINDSTVLGNKILKLAAKEIGCFAMHTNFDAVGGMAELAKERLQLEETKPFCECVEVDEKIEGIGRIGYLPKEMTVSQCADFVKQQFNLSSVAVYGDLERKVKKVAVSPGSGRHMIEDALSQQVELFITGDIGHHEGLDAIDGNLAVIDAGHYGLEHIFVPFVADYLTKVLSKDILVEQMEASTPFVIR